MLRTVFCGSPCGCRQNSAAPQIDSLRRSSAPARAPRHTKSTRKGVRRAAPPSRMRRLAMVGCGCGMCGHAGPGRRKASAGPAVNGQASENVRKLKAVDSQAGPKCALSAAAGRKRTVTHSAAPPSGRPSTHAWRGDNPRAPTRGSSLRSLRPSPADRSASVQTEGSRRDGWQRQRHRGR